MKPHLQTLTYITLILGFLVISPDTTTAQQQISIDSISAYISQRISDCSKVFGTHVTNSEKPVTYLNLGAAYPDHKLTLVIFQKDKPNFQSSPEEYYNLQEVCATGKLKEYKGKAEMVLNNSSQIVIK